MIIPDTLTVFGAEYLFIAIGGLALIHFLRQPRTIQRQMVVLAAIAWPLTLLAARLIAFFYYDPRPFVVGHFLPLIPHEPDNGFPSDHTLLSAAISSLLFPFGKKPSVVAWVLTLLVGFSRIHAGIHHPIDVLGSIGISILTTVAVFQAINCRSESQPR